MNYQIKTLNNKDNLAIQYGFHQMQLGLCLLAMIGETVCHLSFHDNEKTGFLELQKEWPKAALILANEKIMPLIRSIFSNQNKNLTLALKGTDFQIKVWHELLKIPSGNTVSYEEIAKSIGKPTAVRAVATAIAQNKIAYLIPCHRVIRKSGTINNYRWGIERKKKLLVFEISQ
jgi:AraC family transcriptional regulator of adaptative response/methylated-DNA-[protein]-cysteine methyltransferase